MVTTISKSRIIIIIIMEEAPADGLQEPYLATLNLTT